MERAPQKADVLISGLDGDTPEEAARGMGHDEVGNYLSYHWKRQNNWKNRQALLKMYLCKSKTTVFKSYTLGIFKEIIKYA